MTLDEYIEESKAELDKFREHYKQENKKDPENWPLEAEDIDWAEQELGFRF